MTRTALLVALASALAIAGCNRPLPPHVNPPDVRPAASSPHATTPGDPHPAASPSQPAG
jgi:hypothetical protein